MRTRTFAPRSCAPASAAAIASPATPGSKMYVQSVTERSARSIAARISPYARAPPSSGVTALPATSGRRTAASASETSERRCSASGGSGGGGGRSSSGIRARTSGSRSACARRRIRFTPRTRYEAAPSTGASQMKPAQPRADVALVEHDVPGRDERDRDGEDGGGDGPDVSEHAPPSESDGTYRVERPAIALGGMAPACEPHGRSRPRPKNAIL